VKLDFKALEAVEPVLRFLRAELAAGRALPMTDGGDGQVELDSSSSSSSSSSSCGCLLWLNADVLPGPGFPSSSAPTVAARPFLDVCARLMPVAGAVLSLGWNTTAQAPEGEEQLYYTHAHVEAMLALLAAYPSLQHAVTYPLRCSLLARSWAAGSLQRLLAACPLATLTVWTSRVEQQGGSHSLQATAQQHEHWARTSLPKHRTFLDLVLD